VGYAIFGARVGVAMALNALIGGVAALAAQSLAARSVGRRGSLAAGLFVALEPALVLYTPALMTEAVAGGLVCAAGAIAAAKWPERAPLRALAAGLVLGIGVLVRPEVLLLAPIIGVLSSSELGLRRVLASAAIVLGASLCVCLPWTVRNCDKLERCALVSVNGGWNLFIGSSPLGRGGWAPLESIGVPEECRTVFAEAEKDACFGRAGARVILERPGAWLALVPAKLAATFDYGTAAAHYLSASNPKLVGESEKTLIGALELLGQRVLLLLGLFALARAEGPARRARFVICALSGVMAFLPWAFVGWVGMVVSGLLLGRALVRSPPMLLAVSTVAMTAAVHAVFFGASRYTLVCLPSLGALAGTALAQGRSGRREPRARFDSRGEVAG
jgi:4-amino-4-deoxy-L-arabinose transferase-like glycosyltransferase